jgi:hypothetical protein
MSVRATGERRLLLVAPVLGKAFNGLGSDGGACPVPQTQ